MTFATHGGPADSGRKLRTLKALEPKQAWACPRCGLVMPGYLIRCLTMGCNEKRPRAS